MDKSESQEPVPQYDAHIIPAESAARQRREGKSFGHTSHQEADGTLSHATAGYTVDKEGLLNNYAIEPEMYVDVPGDLRVQAAQEKADHIHEMLELSEEEDGKLTKEHDWRHKGPGMI